MITKERTGNHKVNINAGYPNDHTQGYRSAQYDKK